MALDRLKLDDLDWRTLMDSIRRRIAAASDGQWTLHSPVDPGVTLLELYAWLIEQRIFWLDQVPDSLVRASLRLLGTRDAATVAARTVLRLDPAVAPTGWLARRSRFELEESSPSLQFTTLHTAAVIDVATTSQGEPAVTVTSTTEGKTQTLSRLSPLPLFSTTGAPGEVRIDFNLRMPPPASVRAAFHMLVELDVSRHIAPQWHPTDVRTAPPACALRWWYSVAGGRREFAAGQITDSTLGLRRSGLLAIGSKSLASWAPESSARPNTYSLWVTADEPRFTYPPRLRSIVPNVVVAEHRRRVTGAEEHVDWLPLPNRQLALDASVRRDGDGPMETGAEVGLRERDGIRRTWRAVRDMTFHEGDARVFVVERDKRRLVFGDGYRGRLPNLASGLNARASVWLGGGERGNVGIARYWERQGSTPVVARGAFNVVPGIGGRSAQTIAEARTNAAAKLKQITRAVTGPDFQTLAKETPGVDVARAHAAVGHHPCHVCPVAGAVTVFILPWAPRDESIPPEQIVAAPVADVGMLDAVRRRLDHARLIGSEVFVRPVPYRAVHLRLDLEGETLGLAAVQQRIEARLRKFLDPLIGNSDEQGWPFGAGLRPSLLLQEAQNAIGRGLTVRRTAIGLDGGAPEEDCNDVEIGANALPFLASIDFTILAAAVTGGLR